MFNGNLIQVNQEHFYTHERKYAGKSDRQVFEAVDNSGEGEIQGSEPKDGEHVRRVNDELVLGDGEDGRNAVYGKNQVRGFYENQAHEQRRTVELGFLTNKERIAVQFLLKGNDLAGKSYGEALVGVDLDFASGQYFPCRKKKNGTEYVNDPVEVLDKGNSGEYENHAENDRSEDSPEEHLVLISLGDGEIREYDREHEDVVY